MTGKRTHKMPVYWLWHEGLRGTELGHSPDVTPPRETLHRQVND